MKNFLEEGPFVQVLDKLRSFNLLFSISQTSETEHLFLSSRAVFFL